MLDALFGIVIAADALSVALSATAVMISGIAVIVTIYFGHRSSRTAHRALELSEVEHRQRERDRQALPEFEISFGGIPAKDTTDDGAVLVPGGNAWIRLPISVTNSGDRESGRGELAVRVPATINDYGMRWCDMGGNDLPDYPQRAARSGDHNILTRPLESIAPGFTDEFFINLPIQGSPQGVTEHLVEVRVRAAGAKEATADFALRTERRS